MTYNWGRFGIDINKVTGGKSLCPKCSETRKNKHEKCLSVDIEEGIFNCHHCGWHGTVKEFKQKKEYSKPIPRLEKVSQKVIEYFENDRKISNNTLLRFKITEATEYMPQLEKEVLCICFNYYRNDELTNIKFRGPKKSFKLTKDAELIFYNLDCLKNAKECVIVEGEIDCLTVYEVGYHTVISVPNGAAKGNQKLEYLDNCWEWLEPLDKVIIMTDNDEPGILLREELARRIGKDKCYRVEYPEGMKDPNQVLVELGADKVLDMIKCAKPWPIDGVIEVDDLYPDIVQLWEHGYPKGQKAGIPDFDDLLSFVGGQMTIVTGIPGHGKTEAVDFIMAQLVKNHDWKFGVCSFETQPSSLHVTKLQEKISGKAFGFRSDKAHRMTQSQFEHSLIKVADHFFFINVDENDLTVDGLIAKAEQLVKKKGINGFLLDPWNYVEHKIPQGYSETQYVSEALTTIVRFCRRFDVHLFLVAHPTKISKVNGKYDVPTMYNINGSSNFFNKTHNGICIYRDYETNVVTWYVQKVKHSWLGKIGFAQFNYDVNTRQYVPLGGLNNDEQTDQIRTMGWWNKD